MSKVTDWKVALLQKALADFAGINKVVAINLLSTLGIGQLLLISKVVADKLAPADLLTIINGISNKADLDPIVETIKGKGFTQGISLANFSSQLKAEKLIMLEALLADKEGIKILQIGTSALLDDYIYIR